MPYILCVGFWSIAGTGVFNWREKDESRGDANNVNAQMVELSTVQNVIKSKGDDGDVDF